MSNFESRIQAILDTTKFDADMEALLKKKYMLTNIQADTGVLEKEIKKAISSVSFDVNLNPVIKSGSAANVGKSYGKSFSQGLESAVNTNIKGGATNLLKDILGTDIGINKSAVSQIIKGIAGDVGEANLQIKNMRTYFANAVDAANGLRSVKITGIDAFGNVVTTISKIDEETGKVASSLTSVAQNFDHSSEAAKEASTAFNELYSIAKQIGALEIKIAGLDTNKDAAKIEALQKRLNDLRDTYDILRDLSGDKLSSDHLVKLGSVADDTRNKIALMQAQMSDSKKATYISDGYKKLYDTAKQISGLEIKIAGLDEEKNKAQIAALELQLKELKNTYDELKYTLGGELSHEQLEALEAVTKKTANEMALLKAKAEDAKNNLSPKLVSFSKYNSFNNKLTSWLEKNTKAAKEFGPEINSLIEKLKKLYNAGELTEEELQKLAVSFADVTSRAKTAGKTGRSFGDSLTRAFKGLSKYITVDNIIDGAIDAIKEMCKVVYEIDTAMTDLIKVTDETDARYNSFLKESAKNAKELGRSISSYVEQTAAWAKLGYSLDESEELAKLSSVYANVADLDDSTAVSDMVTAMKAFNIEAENAVNIIDPLNELGNSFATSAADLGEGLSNSASAMNAAGTDMYKTLAMLTGGAEITQDAGEFGNFLKVSSMRIRGMKGELEELGEEVDESVDSISKVQTQILNLTSGKVNIFDANGDFRDYYEIIEDIAEVYDELDSTDQAKLTEILFGKMRGNQGQALIQAFQSGRVQEAYETALNSSGSAALEQSKWMNSLEAKIQQFQAAWQELSITVIDSDFLKGLVDAGTSLLGVLTGIIDHVGVLNTLVLGGGAAAFFKNLD